MKDADLLRLALARSALCILEDKDGALRDTLWFSNYETLVDYLRSFLNVKSGGTEIQQIAALRSYIKDNAGN